MNSFFASRDIDRCLEDLASDLVWISPVGMHHFLTAEEVRGFLQEDIKANPERRFVDILSIKSSPSAESVSTVAYEVNLVPKDHAQTVNLRCSMAICKRGQHYEISFIHMSEKLLGGAISQIKDFTQYLPCGIMIFAYLGEEGLRLIFCNDYFREKLRYKEETWQKLAEKDPFFMVTDGEHEELLSKLREISGTHSHFAVNVTFCRRDGKKFRHRVLGAPAYKEGDNTVYYCVFQETTGFHVVHGQLRQKAELSSGILRALPGGLCVFAGQDKSPVYVSRILPEMFGREPEELMEGLQRDPFYGLQITDITKDKLTQSHVDLAAADPYAGTFQLVKGDGERRWTNLYLIHAKMKDGEPVFMQLYIDTDEQKQEALRRIEQAENLSRTQQERAGEELRMAQEAAASEAAALREEMQGSIEAAQKERDARIAAVERERDARIAAVEKERDMRIDALMQESENLRRELLKMRGRILNEEPVKPVILKEEPVKQVILKEDPVKQAILQEEPVKPEILREEPEEPAAPSVSAETDKTGAVLFSPAELIEEVCGEAEPKCYKKGVKLTMLQSPTLPARVIGDETRIRKAMEAILGSVAENTPTGDVITVAGRADKAAGGRVILYYTVRDSRSGIAEKLRTGLFDKKSAEQDSLRNGLYAARELLQPVGGTVQVRGRHGEGTAFILTVRLLLE